MALWVVGLGCVVNLGDGVEPHPGIVHLERGVGVCGASPEGVHPGTGSGLRVKGAGCRVLGVQGLHEGVDGEDEVLSGGAGAVLGRTALEDALQHEHRVGEAGPGERVVERGAGESHRSEDLCCHELVATEFEEPFGEPTHLDAVGLNGE